ncbi:MAG TPA: tRNA (5-methylaminomethyl-2-thiouridine)(34)-methyltransferase MnmD [Saprospiraceae bacterium]|nr:tRNA (5-methylaminomethyl-2-thiouridine)(34)-methyltransferase MnmD [Saprospiraceae bacterium]
MEPDSIIETQDGSHSIFSKSFGVSYHSKYGAIQESRHVFIDSGLVFKLSAQKSLSILEAGFGTGLNALLTLQEAARHKVKITYEAVEAYPIPFEQACLLNYPSILGEDIAPQFLELHKSTWGATHSITPYFTFRKRQIRFEEIQDEDAYDLVYFDAFAPGTQPELWDEAVLGNMYRALKIGGALVTYCAKGVVKRTLMGLGFTIESLKGPPGKREMTRAIKS